jgi:hypothetical protein
VGSDPEMTPRQALNTVVGHSDTSTGVFGSSNNGLGVYGFSSTSNGVVGQTLDPGGVGVLAFGAGSSGKALRIINGSISVDGAGIGASTPVFVHVVSGTNVTAFNETIITHPLTDGDPDAILIITPSYNYHLAGGVNDAHPVGVFYRSDLLKWVIYNIDNGAMTAVCNSTCWS